MKIDHNHNTNTNTVLSPRIIIIIMIMKIILSHNVIFPLVAGHGWE